MRKGYWECDNCQIRDFNTEFPKTWIHLKSIMVAEGVCVFGYYRRPYNQNYPMPPQPDFSAYRKEIEKTFCSKDCYVKYMAKMFLTSGDTTFNPSSKFK